MAWPSIDWDNVQKVDMATAIAALYTAFWERIQAGQALSLIQEPAYAHTYPFGNDFLKSDTTTTKLPAPSDAIQPFLRPSESSGGYINYNLNKIYENTEVWSRVTGLLTPSVAFSIVSSNPATLGYTYLFTQTLGGTNWTGVTIINALSLHGNFFNELAGTNIMDADKWAEMKTFLNALIYVKQYKVSPAFVATFVQNIDISSYLTDQA